MNTCISRKATEIAGSSREFLPVKNWPLFAWKCIATRQHCIINNVNIYQCRSYINCRLKPRFFCRLKRTIICLKMHSHSSALHNKQCKYMYQLRSYRNCRLLLKVYPPKRGQSELKYNISSGSWNFRRGGKKHLAVIFFRPYPPCFLAWKGQMFSSWGCM